MFRWIIGPFRCLLGKHERSEKHIRKLEGTERFTSICTFCRKPLMRRYSRDWIVIPKS